MILYKILPALLLLTALCFQAQPAQAEKLMGFRANMAVMYYLEHKSLEAIAAKEEFMIRKGLETRSPEELTVIIECLLAEVQGAPMENTSSVSDKSLKSFVRKAKGFRSRSELEFIFQGLLEKL